MGYGSWVMGHGFWVMGFGGAGFDQGSEHFANGVASLVQATQGGGIQVAYLMSYLKLGLEFGK